MSFGIPVTQARAALSDLVSRAAFGGERISLTRHGRVVAALVSAADLERLEALDREPLRLREPRVDPAPPPAERRFGIAAEHRPPGMPGVPGGSSGGGRRPPPHRY